MIETQELEIRLSKIQSNNEAAKIIGNIAKKEAEVLKELCRNPRSHII